MFDITGDDIALLSDEDLRTLIGLLCEAELRRQGLPVSAATWGGNQTAADGGLDVRVALPAGTTITGFVSNPQTGFQVKKSEMPRADILAEMKPHGTLRPVIIELADAAGAYVIVSSGDSTTDSILARRRAAMLEALEGSPAEGKLALDFYDRGRVASWVRDHVGWIPWVRSKIGKAMAGWQSHGSWSLAPSGVEANYLADDKARIYTGDGDDGDGISAVEGIEKIRNVLRTPGHVVRLAGLSGVGKTRLAEALFDARVGEGALDPSLAVYTNEADTPNPPPVGLASDLNAASRRAILIVDNCPPALHHRLSEVARAKGSTISLLTIEYDIRDDQPEGTDVFRLETLSIPLIEKLVARRYFNLSQVDAHTIAEFSGGNARVGLALASRIEKTETVAGLSEEDLFKRLFQQRHDPDPALLAIGQACSLVYSFDGETLAGEEAELPVLGALAGKTAEEVYSGVAELKRRDLVQARAQWRAVLPHAIANRLAKMALQNIPPSKVQALLVDQATPRLRRSFSRRLGYLDDSKEAKAIVKGWLEPGGLLGDIAKLDELHRDVFVNVAPVMPETALSALERLLSAADDATLGEHDHFIRLLRALAYEPEFFPRCLALLARFAAIPSDDGKETEAESVVQSLFHITLSGTRAPLNMRLVAAEGLLGSDDARLQKLGVSAIEALLKTSHFSSHYEFDFGARSRSFGYHPPTAGDVRAWFAASLKLAGKYALGNQPIADQAKKAVTREFRGLWSHSGCAAELDQLMRDIGGKSFWRDGWVAARQARSLDGKALGSQSRDRLTALEEFLRPKDLANKVRGLVIGARGSGLGLDDFEEPDDAEAAASEKGEIVIDYAARAARFDAQIRALAHDVAHDADTLMKLLPELTGGNGKIAPFGEALAEVTDDWRVLWTAMVAQFAADKRASTQLLSGFIAGLQKRDAAWADTVLDEAVEHSALAEWFPILQSSVAIDGPAIKRLHRALDHGVAPIDRYRNLAYGRASDGIPGPEFRDLVRAIVGRRGGSMVGLEMMTMRLHADYGAKRKPQPEVREAGRFVLAEFEFLPDDGSSSREDHELGVVVKASLAGPEGITEARKLCRKLIAAAKKRDIRAFDYDDVPRALLRIHPHEVLDELFAGNASARKISVEFIQNLLRFDKPVLDAVPDDVLLAWCDRDAATRYPLAAAVGAIFEGATRGELHGWTPLVGKLFARAPEPRLVLNEIVIRLRPTSWSGSLATVLEQRVKLLAALPLNGDPTLVAAASDATVNFEKWIAKEREADKAEDRARNNRFE